jgi:hypothetical protein
MGGMGQSSKEGAYQSVSRSVRTHIPLQYFVGGRKRRTVDTAKRAGEKQRQRQTEMLLSGDCLCLCALSVVITQRERERERDADREKERETVLFVS